MIEFEVHEILTYLHRTIPTLTSYGATVVEKNSITLIKNFFKPCAIHVKFEDNMNMNKCTAETGFLLNNIIIYAYNSKEIYSISFIINKLFRRPDEDA